MHYFSLSFIAVFQYCSTILLLVSTFLFIRHKRKGTNNRLKSPSLLMSESARRTQVIPSPSISLPFIGHLHILTNKPHHALAKLAQKLGPIFQLQLGQIPTIIISSSHFARLVLKTYDHVFANRPKLLSAQYLTFGLSDITFAPLGPYWRQARKICITELLSPKRVNSYGTVLDEEVNRMLGSVNFAIQQSGSSQLDMSKLFFTLSNDVLCRVAFGKRFINNMEEEGEKEKSRLLGVLAEAMALFAGFSPGDFYPDWKWINSLTGFKRRLEKTEKDLSAVCDEIIQQHVMKRKEKVMSSIETTTHNEDFVDVLLRVKEQDNLQVPLTDDNLKALVMDMFVAGTDTTSATLEWTMTELVRHPTVLKKAQDEVRKHFSNAGKVDENHFQNLHYMKAVVKETMRLHPAAPLLVPRESMENCVLDGYEIPAKTRILINAYAIGRDPETWKNPLDYNPERFVENNIDIRDQEFRLLPFGGGRRICPGYAFGLATIEIALARLLYHFDWALPQVQGVRSNDVDLDENFGLVSKKKTALVLVPTVNKLYEFKETPRY